MLFGIQSAQNVLLSEVVRALDEDITAKKTEDRLNRNLANKDIEAKVHAALVADAGRFVHDDTLLIIDPSDVQKPYAKKMELLSKVYDGSKGDVGDNLGYNACMAVACENGSRRIVPLHLRLWSKLAEGFKSDNDEVFDLIRGISSATGKRGVYVYDRGGDGDPTFDFFLEESLDFVVRLVGNRNLVSWGAEHLAESLARQCVMEYRDTVQFKSHNKVVDVPVQFGSMPARLPGHPDKALRLVVVKWPRGEKPMMLLTTETAVRSRKALFWVVRAYLTRWRVEDTIRFIKQAYSLENLRLLTYRRLKNMAAIVAAVAYFAAAWLGRGEKLSAMVEHVTKISRRMFEVPEFFYYAIADGIRWLFTRHGRWRDTADPDEVEESSQMEFAF